MADALRLQSGASHWNLFIYCFEEQSEVWLRKLFQPVPRRTGVKDLGGDITLLARGFEPTTF